MQLRDKHSPARRTALYSPPARQGGQVLPLALAGVVLAAVLMFVLANNGNRITEKSTVVNAADAAAYSGATWVAEHLNFMAYTNRAMIANHVGVGHFVAYVSWIRYVEDVADKVEDIAQFVPYVNVAAAAVEEFATVLRQVAEESAPIFIPAVDGVNRFYSLAQREAHATLIVGNTGGVGNVEQAPVGQLMQAVAATFDPAIKINDRETLSQLDGIFSAPLGFVLARQRAEIGAFVQARDVSARDGEFVGLVEQTFGRGTAGFFSAKGEMSAEWLNDREWSFLSIRKRSRTRHALTDDLADWQARDRLRRKTLFGFGPSVTLASGNASAREFDDGYRGIRDYYGLSSARIDHHTVPIVAFASKSQQAIVHHDVFDLQTPNKPVSGLSIAVVEHVRPKDGFAVHKLFNAGIGGGITGETEYANLYNPFWQARTIGIQFFDLTKAVSDLEILPLDAL